MKKERASMNRTITLSKEDYEELRNDIVESYSELNKIILGDFDVINATIPDKIANVILLDPPYNITKQYSENLFKAMPEDEYFKYVLDMFDKCLPKLTDDGTMYICGDWKSSYIQRKALQVLEEQGKCDVINRITWSRDKGRGANNNWKNNIEDIWMVVRDKNNYYFNLEGVKMKKKVIAPYKDKSGNNKDWALDDEGVAFRMTCPSNVWFDITVPFWSMSENTDHPTQKSEKLYAKLILASSKPDDVIYEPFAGVCSGAVTAKKLDRRYLALERELEYCLLGQKRLNVAEVNKNIQGYEDGIFRDK